MQVLLALPVDFFLWNTFVSDSAWHLIRYKIRPDMNPEKEKNQESSILELLHIIYWFSSHNLRIVQIG